MKSQQTIIADKELFRLWYEFYRLALSSPEDDIQKALKKSKNFYADWEVSSNLHFDDWWRTHRKLFYDLNLVRITDETETKSSNNLYITVPKGKSYSEILGEFKTLIEKEYPVKNKRHKIPTLHRYAPTEIQGVKRESLRMMLDLQKNIFSISSLKGAALTERVTKYFSSERYKKKKNIVPMSFAVHNDRNSHSEEADRNIRRYRQKAKKLLLNVALGKFPGKY